MYRTSRRKFKAMDNQWLRLSVSFSTRQPPSRNSLTIPETFRLSSMVAIWATLISFLVDDHRRRPLPRWRPWVHLVFGFAGGLFFAIEVPPIRFDYRIGTYFVRHQSSDAQDLKILTK
jgi:hypothetical protein